jgi:ATP-binding cassette subfamily C protein LapB
MLNQQAAVQSLLEMIECRNLHASRYEVERAWNDVAVKNESDRLAVVWRTLFPGHTVLNCPIKLATNSQLPAWVVAGESIGLLTKTSTRDEVAKIDWAQGYPVPLSIDDAQVWVPVASVSEDADSAVVPSKKLGLAREAITVAIKAHRTDFTWAALASFFISSVAILVSLFALQVYDRVVPNFATATLWFLASGVFLALVIDFLLKYARMRLLEASESRVDEALSQFFFDRTLQLKVDRRPKHVGMLVAQVRDYEAIKGFFTSSTLFAITDLPFIAIYIFVIWAIGGPVAWVPTVFVLACLLVGLISYRPIAKAQREALEATIRRQGLLFEAVSGTEMIKAQGSEARFGDLWLEATRETVDRTQSLREIDTVATNFTQLFQQVATVCVLIVGVYVIAAGNMTLGGLIACSILAGRALGATSGISRLLLRWHHARFALQTLDALLENPSDHHASRQANTRAADLDLRLVDVKYSYRSDYAPQLSIPNLEIKQGERIAVLGSNGSGKSTLLKLLAGINTPSSGQVQLAQLDLENCKPSWLRETIGFLPQDVRLFAGSLLDNLTWGLSLPTEGDVLKAMQETGLDRVLKNHADGLMLRINEGGTGLSGGQRQLVALTRLVLQKPKIWLLDEAGDGLDREAELQVINIINKLPDDCTVVFTTHKTNWLDASHRVIALEDGQVRLDEPRSKIVANTESSNAKSDVETDGVA